MVNEIADFNKWESLAHSFGLEDNDIEVIQEYDKKEHHQRLAEKWYEIDEEFSWSKLRRELDKLYPRSASNASVSSPPPETTGNYYIPLSSSCRMKS